MALAANVRTTARWNGTQTPPAVSIVRCSRANVIIDTTSATTAIASHAHCGRASARPASAKCGASHQNSPARMATISTASTA